LAGIDAHFNESAAKFIATVGDNADEYDLIDAATNVARDIAYAGGWNWGLYATDLDLLQIAERRSQSLQKRSPSWAALRAMERLLWTEQNLPADLRCSDYPNCEDCLIEVRIREVAGHLLSRAAVEHWPESGRYALPGYGVLAGTALGEDIDEAPHCPIGDDEEECC
jgi:hypothetical protein